MNEFEPVVANPNAVICADDDTVPAGTTYGTPIPLAGNPPLSTITMLPNGTFDFMNRRVGTYRYNVPVCPAGQASNCPMELLTIYVVDTCKVQPVCRDVNVFLNPENCKAELLETGVMGPCAPADSYVIVYDGVNMTPELGYIIDRPGIFPYSAFRYNGGLICLGQVRALDNGGPVFENNTARESWKLIDTFFTENPNNLVSHHLESYNDFFNKGIYRIFKENNPIRFIER